MAFNELKFGMSFMEFRINEMWNGINEAIRWTPTCVTHVWWWVPTQMCRTNEWKMGFYRKLMRMCCRWNINDNYFRFVVHFSGFGWQLSNRCFVGGFHQPKQSKSIALHLKALPLTSQPIDFMTSLKWLSFCFNYNWVSAKKCKPSIEKKTTTNFQQN